VQKVVAFAKQARRSLLTMPDWKLKALYYRTKIDEIFESLKEEREYNTKVIF
jgi:hypothetical protein